MYLRYGLGLHNPYFLKWQIIIYFGDLQLPIKRILFVNFSILLFFTLFSQLTIAQVRTVGVEEGDWFKYNLSINYDSELNFSSEDFPLADFLVGEQIVFTIENVSGTNVTGFFTISYENGTEHSQYGSIDIITGEGDLRNWLISSDLNEGNSLYASETEEMINETITQTYYWGSRETNHLVYSFNFSSGEDYSYLRADMFWDKELGIITELSFEADVRVNGTSYDASAEVIINESNVLESVPEFNSTSLILTIVVITLSISYLKYKKSKK